MLTCYQCKLSTGDFWRQIKLCYKMYILLYESALDEGQLQINVMYSKKAIPMAI